MTRPIQTAILSAFLICQATAFEDSKNNYTNSIGMRMVRIPAGKFRMGSDLPTDAAELKQSKALPNGDFDEKPVHDVTLSYDFYMSDVEVTTQQFQLFREDYGDAG